VTPDPQPQAVPTHSEPDSADVSPIFEAPAVLRLLWADPQHAAEHLAIWSVKRFAGRASSAVDRIRSAHQDADDDTLQRLVIERQTRIAMTEGAFVGGPFIVLIPVAFCAALLAQAQLGLELAVLAGRAPDDERRAADLLVLQSAYDTTEEAHAALATVARDPHRQPGKRLPRGTRWTVLKRMAYLLGVLGSTEEKPSVIRMLLQWSFVGIVFLVGLVLPLVWVPYMALSVRRSTLSVGARGVAFYAQSPGEDVGVRIARAATVHVPMTAALIRTVLLVAIPIVIAVVGLLTGASFGGGKLLDAGILLLAGSALITLGWLGFRWWRMHRERDASLAGAQPPVGPAP
jgi:hypothetical protein